MAEVAVQTKPTIALDDATLGRIAALWTAAFPTAEGRDRCAEAIERRATTAATDEEQLHYVEVKNCHLVYSDGWGYFPDSVSERASRHVEALAALVAPATHSVRTVWKAGKTVYQVGKLPEAI